ALALIGDLERGGTSADFRAQLTHVAELAKLNQAKQAEEAAHHNFDLLKHVAPSLVPGQGKDGHDTPDEAEASLVPGRPKPQPRKLKHNNNPGDDVPMLDRQRG